MNVYQWLCLLGVPGLLTAAFGFLIRITKQTKKDSDAVKSGVQALLRAQMINDWNHYSKKGYAPIYAKENFENCWKQYHGLGANGVMDEIHKKFLALPDEKQEK
ncbi:MAG: hypothetical protein ACI4W6_04455 [Acutalibacteraceae bacterium]